MDCLLRCFSIVLFLLVLSSCVSYKEPPAVIYADNYTAKTRDQHRALPQDFTELTVTQAIQAALANNPTYKQKRLAIIQAWSTYYQNLAVFSPSLTGNMASTTTWYNGGNTDGGNKGSGRSSAAANPTAGLVANMNVFNGFQDVFTAMSSLSSAKSTEQLERDYRRQLVFMVIKAYNDVMLDKSQIKIQESNILFQQEQLDINNHRFEVGKISYDEVLNFEIARNGAQYDMITYRENYQVHRYALAALMGLTTADLPQQVVFPELELDESTKYVLSMDAYIDIAINQRPDLQSQRDLLKAARYNLYTQWGTFSPTLDISASYQYNQIGNYVYNASPINTKFGGIEGPQTSYNLGWGASWLLWDGGSRIAGVRSSQAAYDSAKESLLGAWIQVVEDVRTAYVGLASNIAREKITEATLSKSMAQRDLVRNQYNVGKKSVERLNEVQNTLVVTQQSLANDIIKIYNSRAALDAAIGVME